ncbi:type III secretion system translocon subunit SctE [Verrucomicrobium spinosum]|uniref:type III secretion system translocon subunit SctE n=1 Tax=Verrucomicrobium spinosum TaxID=2736 RepID=UPI00094636D8|nr:type III secretion system translocon subunit SctE [Verrucomicrobium spinosum]
MSDTTTEFDDIELPDAPMPTGLPYETADEWAEMLTNFGANGRTMRDFTNLTPESMEVFYMVAYNQYNAGQYEESSKVFQLLASLDHFDKRYWMGLGSSRAMEGNHKDAIKAFGYLGFLDVSDPVPSFHCARSFIATGKIKERRRRCAPPSPMRKARRSTPSSNSRRSTRSNCSSRARKKSPPPLPSHEYFQQSQHSVHQPPGTSGRSRSQRHQEGCQGVGSEGAGDARHHHCWGQCRCQGWSTRLEAPKATLMQKVTDLTLRIALLQQALDELQTQVSKTVIDGRMKEVDQAHKEQLQNLETQLKEMKEAVEKQQEANKKGNVFQAIASWVMAAVDIVSAVFSIVAAAANFVAGNWAGTVGMIAAAGAQLCSAGCNIALAIDATDKAMGGDGVLSEAQKQAINGVMIGCAVVAGIGGLIGGLGGITMG